MIYKIQQDIKNIGLVNKLIVIGQVIAYIGIIAIKIQWKKCLDETKLLIFNILRELPKDVHLPILITLDLYEELKIIEAELTELNSETYSTEFSDPEEEYVRRKAKELSRNYINWWEDYSGPDTD